MNSSPIAFSNPARLAAGFAGLLLLGLLAVLIAVLASLESTRGEIQTTRAKLSETEARVQRLTEGVDPLLAAAAPLTGREGERDVQRVADQIATAAGLIPDLAGDTTSVVGAAFSIAREVQDADLAGSLTAGRALAEVATPALSDLAETLAAGRALAEVATPALADLAPRLESLFRMASDLRGQLSTVRTTLLDSRRIQRDTRTLAAEGVGLFRESLAIQREILVHVRSLDAKTGGTLPATSP